LTELVGLIAKIKFVSEKSSLFLKAANRGIGMKIDRGT
jgi:hypothetical protein